jgi:hypothetical protein
MGFIQQGQQRPLWVPPPSATTLSFKLPEKPASSEAQEPRRRREASTRAVVEDIFQAICGQLGEAEARALFNPPHSAG